MKKTKWFKLLPILLISSLVAIFFQNCSNVKLAPLTVLKHPVCDPSVYNIAREARTSNGQTVYFVQENNHALSSEYSHQIEWTVNGVIQTNITHDNRLLLNCETHPESVEILAKLVTDCEEPIEIYHSDTAPAICEEQVPESPPGVAPASYCEEYKQKYPGVESQPGFTTNLQKIAHEFHDVFFALPLQRWDPNSFDQPSVRAEEFFGKHMQHFVNGQPIGIPFMKGKYLSIPIHIPESTPDMSIQVTIGENQFFAVTPSGGRMTISPCPGDFRVRDKTSIGQQQGEFLSLTQQGAMSNAIVNFIISNDPNWNPSGGAPVPNLFRIPKGKTVYWNFAHYTFANYNDYGEYQCSDDSMDPGFGEYTIYRLQNFGCGWNMAINKACYQNGVIRRCQDL